MAERLADATSALLAGLIDHAPTFPPARLPTEEALAEDRRARASAESWLLGRLVWPSSRLAELSSYDAVPLSLVLDGPVPVATRVEAVETRWPELPAFDGEIFVEVPLDDELEQNVARLKAAGAFAKVRCGGERTPTSAELARFVRVCSDAGLPFKASAGLHHAVRSGEAHGFLNLLAAAVFAYTDGLTAAELVPLLAEEDPSAFAVDARGFRVHDRSAGPEAIAEARRDLFVAYGSCSFSEPVDDLTALGLLPA
jgi:hypothetical protein